MNLFLSMLATTFLSEMGDKTQFFIIAMATKYKLRDIIIGTVSAIILLNAIAVAAGSALSAIIAPEIMKFIAAVAFFIFAYTNFFSKSDDGEESKSNLNSKFAAAITVAILFFAAEFGDKSQLLAISFASSYGKNMAVSIFVACSLGLILADTLAFIVSYFLGKKLPEKLLITIAGIVFAIFAAITLKEAFDMVLPADNLRALLYTAAVVLLFAAVCLISAVIKSGNKSEK